MENAGPAQGPLQRRDNQNPSASKPPPHRLLPTTDASATWTTSSAWPSCSTPNSPSWHPLRLDAIIVWSPSSRLHLPAHRLYPSASPSNTAWLLPPRTHVLTLILDGSSACPHHRRRADVGFKANIRNAKLLRRAFEQRAISSQKPDHPELIITLAVLATSAELMSTVDHEPVSPLNSYPPCRPRSSQRLDLIGHQDKSIVSRQPHMQIANHNRLAVIPQRASTESPPSAHREPRNRPVLPRLEFHPPIRPDRE